MSIEEWRPVAGYEGLYEVSDLGRVRSLDVRVANGAGTRARRGRVLRQQANDKGYLTVTLSRSSEQRRVQVSRLVGVAFLGLTSDQEIDHRDRNTGNNAKTNLRVATTAQNRMNTAKPRHNTSGYKGVSWHKARGMWRATVGAKHIGHFDDPAVAHAAYIAAAVDKGGEFAHAG